MEYEDHVVPRLREILRERGVRGYSGKKKAELIAMLRASDPQPPSRASPQPQTWKPTRPQCTRPPHPTRPPPPLPMRPPLRLPTIPPIRWSKKVPKKLPKMKRRIKWLEK